MIKKRDHTYDDYVQDQLQHARTLADQADVLHQHVRVRIKAARAAIDGRPPSKAPKGSLKDSISDYHAVERMLDERAFYPPHDLRTDSPKYAKVHHQMTVVDDKHCLVCGVQHSTLHKPSRNPFGAVQMETHHHTIEWALANAIDPAKFNQHICPACLTLRSGVLSTRTMQI